MAEFSQVRNKSSVCTLIEQELHAFEAEALDLALTFGRDWWRCTSV
jgi:hypothetical protein